MRLFIVLSLAFPVVICCHLAAVVGNVVENTGDGPTGSNKDFVDSEYNDIAGKPLKHRSPQKSPSPSSTPRSKLKKQKNAVKGFEKQQLQGVSSASKNFEWREDEEGDEAPSLTSAKSRYRENLGDKNDDEGNSSIHRRYTHLPQPIEERRSLRTGSPTNSYASFHQEHPLQTQYSRKLKNSQRYTNVSESSHDSDEYSQEIDNEDLDMVPLEGLSVSDLMCSRAFMHIKSQYARLTFASTFLLYTGVTLALLGLILNVYKDEPGVRPDIYFLSPEDESLPKISLEDMDKFPTLISPRRNEVKYTFP